jgi:hypothetical protein
MEMLLVLLGLAANFTLPFDPTEASTSHLRYDRNGAIVLKKSGFGGSR